MLLATFHTIARHDPDVVLPIDLPPSCTNCLVGSGRRQNCKFERTSGNTFLLAEFHEKCGQLGVRQRAVMFYLADFRTSRQKLVEMTTPAGRILTLAIAAH